MVRTTNKLRKCRHNVKNGAMTFHQWMVDHFYRHTTQPNWPAITDFTDVIDAMGKVIRRAVTEKGDTVELPLGIGTISCWKQRVTKAFALISFINTDKWLYRMAWFRRTEHLPESDAYRFVVYDSVPMNPEEHKNIIDFEEK